MECWNEHRIYWMLHSNWTPEHNLLAIAHTSSMCFVQEDFGAKTGVLGW